MPEDSARKANQSLSITRRSFLESIGAATVAVAVPVAAAAPEVPASADTDELVSVLLDINGTPRKALIEPRSTLLNVLRETLGMTGTKQGCERGECGGCTVLFDGLPRYSCLTLATEAEGHKIKTIEGLLHGEELSPVQQAFVEEDGFQCGYCTSGQIMSAEGLLLQNPDPTPDEIRRAMSGNLCRCGSYVHIFRSIQRAAVLRKQQGGVL